jgi:sugar lactone lactonase YvrE
MTPLARSGSLVAATARCQRCRHFAVMDSPSPADALYSAMDTSESGDDCAMLRDSGFNIAVRRLCIGAILGLGIVDGSNAAPSSVELPSGRAYPESITATSDGTLYVSSFADGGVVRAKPGQAKAEPFIAPGAYGTRSTFGVLADERSGTLWVCSNDASAFNVPGPSDIAGSFLKGFDLATGAGKVSAALPGSRTLCNDIAVGQDGSIFVTNSFAPEILRLPRGGTTLEIWLIDPLFVPPKDGPGLDGITFGSDGNIYVNTFATGTLLRVAVQDGRPGKVTQLVTSRPISFPDALRPLDGNKLLMIEGAGSLDRVTISGNSASIETIADKFIQPTGVAVTGSTAWITEGQLSRLIHPSEGERPRLPFELHAVSLTGR